MQARTNLWKTICAKISFKACLLVLYAKYHNESNFIQIRFKFSFVLTAKYDDYIRIERYYSIVTNHNSPFDKFSLRFVIQQLASSYRDISSTPRISFLRVLERIAHPATTYYILLPLEGMYSIRFIVITSLLQGSVIRRIKSSFVSLINISSSSARYDPIKVTSC